MTGKSLDKNIKVQLGLLEAKVGRDTSISWCKAALNSRKASKTVKNILDSTADPEAAILQLRRQKIESKFFHTRTKVLPKNMKKVKVLLTQKILKKIKTAGEGEKAALQTELLRTKSLDHLKLANWTFNTQVFKNEEYLQAKLKELEITLPSNEGNIEIEGIDKILSIKCYQDALKACRSDLVLFLRKLLHETVEVEGNVKLVEPAKDTRKIEKIKKPLRSDQSFFMESLNADESDVDEELSDVDSGDNFNGREVAFSDDEEEAEAYGEYLNESDDGINGKNKKKKNRLGQLARRRLAESKFGSEAKHIKNGGLTVLQREELRKQKSQQRKEKAARIKKDVKKASEFLKKEGKDSNSASTTGIKIDPKMHPSWAAKLQQQAKIQQASFSGQKIKFED